MHADGRELLLNAAPPEITIAALTDANGNIPDTLYIVGHYINYKWNHNLVWGNWTKIIT